MDNNITNILKAPYSLGVDITNKCNYRCLHCYNASGENTVIDNELTDNEFISLFEELGNLNLDNICFCGGEPLLRKDLIIKCCKKIKSISSKVTLSMVSNGYYLDEETLNALINAGITHIQISLDGSNSETCFNLRRNENAFSKAINALTLLSKSKISYNIAFCPTKHNISQLDEVTAICKKLKISEIRIQPLMLIGRANKNLEEILPNKLQYIELLRKVTKINRDNLFLEFNWGDPISHIFEHRDNTKKLTTYFSIKANGSISPSPYLPIIVGNIRKHKFSEYCEKGLLNVWSLDIIQNISENIYSISDMGKQVENLPTTWLDDDIEIDLIDDASTLKFI